MMRSILAVLAGFGTMVVLVLLSTPLLARLLPGSTRPNRSPTPAYLAVNLFSAVIIAALGGWIASHLAPSSPFAHLVALGVLIVLAGAASAVSTHRSPQYAAQPVW